MDALSLHIDLTAPRSWNELDDRQLRYVFGLIASGVTSEELKATCLLHWGGIDVIGKSPDGAYLIATGDKEAELKPTAIAEALPSLDWLSDLPQRPVRLSQIGDAKALPADFLGVPFQTYMICENLYQGFLHSQRNELLDQLAAALYGKEMRLTEEERISVFYWMASLKSFLSARFKDFFQPVEESASLLGSPTDIGAQLQESMDAQIRALTKGDITKEAEILKLDTWRALTELNAQAKEYHQLNKQIKPH